MFITNPSSLSQDSVYKCSKKLGKKLIEQYKIPILSIESGYYFFAKTDKLLEILNTDSAFKGR